MYNKSDWLKWVTDFETVIATRMQSGSTLSFKSSVMQFGFITIPAGGAYAEGDAEYEAVLKRKTVISIRIKMRIASGTLYWSLGIVAIEQTITLTARNHILRSWLGS